MDEKEIADAAYLKALEVLIVRTYNLAVRRFPDFNEDVLAENERTWLSDMDRLAIGTSDPAMSDHIAGEFQQALSSLLASARRARSRR